MALIASVSLVLSGLSCLYSLILSGFRHSTFEHISLVSSLMDCVVPCMVFLVTLLFRQLPLV
jgi:hypothetical protein